MLKGSVYMNRFSRLLRVMPSQLKSPLKNSNNSNTIPIRHTQIRLRVDKEGLGRIVFSGGPNKHAYEIYPLDNAFEKGSLLEQKEAAQGSTTDVVIQTANNMLLIENF